MTQNTTAIILKRRDFREADLEITYLSRDWGKMRAVAIGAKKIISKLAGNLEPWREVRLMVAKGKNFDKLGQIKILNNFSIQSNLSVVAVLQAQKASHLIDKMITWKQNERGLYQLSKEFFEVNFLAKFSENLYTIFSWSLVNLVGLKPLVKKCLKCHKDIKIEISFFDYLSGGLFCEKCSTEKNLQLQRLSPAVTGWLLAMQQYPIKKLVTKKMSLKTIQDLDNLLNNFLKFHL